MICDPTLSTTMDNVAMSPHSYEGDMDTRNYPFFDSVIVSFIACDKYDVLLQCPMASTQDTRKYTQVMWSFSF